MNRPENAGIPCCAASPSGLRVELNANGSVRRMDCGDIAINLFPGNEAEGGLTNIYLRRLGDSSDAIPLLGPNSPASYRACARGMVAGGTWSGLAFRLRLVLAESAPAWFWHIELENTGTEAQTCDLIHTQDIALAHYGAVRLNEYYVSHYVDHSALRHPRAGLAVASRQNQSMGGRFPWSVIGTLGKGVSYSTDALQFYGREKRLGRAPAALASGLAGARLQHEHSLVAVQDEAIRLEPGAKVARGFFGWFLPDKATATTAADTDQIGQALSLPEAICPPWPETADAARPAPSLFARAPLLDAQELSAPETDALFGAERRHEEREHGELLSFFTGHNCHVVLKPKELRVLRPHGIILRTGGALVPDEAALTSTAWMDGVFHSMVTQGHVSINRFLSTCHSYLDLFRSHGQRVFVDAGEGWQLLGVPSAFSMQPDACRWIYKHLGGLIEAAVSAPDDRHELRLSLSVLKGPPVRFLISHHIALNGDDGSVAGAAAYVRTGDAVSVRAAPDSDVGRRFPAGTFLIEASDGTRIGKIGGDEMLFADSISHGQPFLCFETEPTSSAGLKILGQLIACPAQTGTALWAGIDAGLSLTAPESSALREAAARAGELFPWLIQNALVHFLSPRGLEQYSGGGWGTRDVCQGPVELLLALGHFGPVRDLLCRVFRQQNPDGDWPQWFMFFERERNIRPGDSHGDIVYWPLLALAQYLSATGDAGLLDESLSFFHPGGAAAAPHARVLQHVDQALALISRRVISGTVLAAYGHGDWNDSLQPAKSDMRERLCSSWTVTLSHQTLTALSDAFQKVGLTDRAAAMRSQAAQVLHSFQRLLIVDNVVAGLAYFHEDGKTDYLLHPRDCETGLSYSLLPMVHAVLTDMFTPGQAASHLGLIRERLLGPDGAHLFDRPMPYRGGLQTNFQRAETACYFGREIGLMYTHAHLRYCEALARFGDAAGFFRSLCQFNPIGVREIIPSAALRQCNCYFSSSDPAFADRYEAFESYDRVSRGEVALEGGWRVYSSGAGIGVRLILQCFLGLRQDADAWLVDPVMPPELDGLVVNVRLAGHPVEVTYRIRARGCGTVSLTLNGVNIDFSRAANRYRPGAARVAMEAVTAALADSNNRLCVWIE